MKRSITFAVIVLAAVALATGCGRDEPDLAACKAAMAAQYKDAIATPGGSPSTRPAACGGVDDATLQRFAGEIIAEQMNG